MTQEHIPYSKRIQPVSESGQLLWQLIPAVYRNWDGSHGVDPRIPKEQLGERGDLANYLDAYGVLFDEIKNTIMQRFRDTSPETCQDWLIPYFADLLDVQLVSPDIEGQRMEVARAISWRQRKGTVGCIEEISREVGRYEQTVLTTINDEQSISLFQSVPTVVVQEGYQRVATTARIGTPLHSLYTLGISKEEVPEFTGPLHSSMQPGLQAGTVDFRYFSRAEETVARNPVKQTHAFNDEGINWRQKNPKGIPCYRDTYQDTSVHTVDTRTAGWNTGHYHPHRTLLYTAPREGFFSENQYKVTWNNILSWFQLFDTTTVESIPFITQEDEEGVYEERKLDSVQDNGNTLVLIERKRKKEYGTERQRVIGIKLEKKETEISQRIEVVDTKTYYLKTGFELLDEIVSDNIFQKVTLRGFGIHLPTITITAADSLPLLSSSQASSIYKYVIEDLVLLGNIALDNMRLTITRSAIQNLIVNISNTFLKQKEKLLNVKNSLFENITTTDVNNIGVCQLEYCTVLSDLVSKKLNVSDSILVNADLKNTDKLYLRYSSVPEFDDSVLDASKGIVYEQTITRSQPVFFNETFGNPGCAVLHPVSDVVTRTGAEDGGEMGTFHHMHYVLREQAVIDKLKEFLPVTQQPVLIVHADWDSPI